jgi:hypothetical protein
MVVCSWVRGMAQFQGRFVAEIPRKKLVHILVHTYLTFSLSWSSLIIMSNVRKRMQVNADSTASLLVSGFPGTTDKGEVGSSSLPRPTSLRSPQASYGSAGQPRAVRELRLGPPKKSASEGCRAGASLRRRTSP